MNRPLTEKEKEKILLRRAFDAGSDCFIDGVGEIIRKYKNFDDWYNKVIRKQKVEVTEDLLNDLKHFVEDFQRKYGRLPDIADYREDFFKIKNE